MSVTLINGRPVAGMVAGTQLHSQDKLDPPQGQERRIPHILQTIEGNHQKCVPYFNPL